MTPPPSASPPPSEPRADARLIIANLDCEQTWAGAAADALPLRLRRELAALGTLLRVFAREGDVVWTPLPVRADRLATVTAGTLRLPLPALRCGPDHALAAPTAILAWGETAAVQALRSAHPSPSSCSSTRSTATPSSLVDRLWALPPADAAAAARVNHRFFQLALAQRLGVALPGARPVDSLSALEAAVAQLPADAEGHWVLKTTLSAAGRGRVIGGATDREGAARERRTAERLLARHGPLLFEPWMPRTADLGCCALLGEEALTYLGTHALAVTPGGGFRAVTLARAPALPADDERRLRQLAEQLAEALHAEGYRGPFGLDAWRYRDRHGRVVLQPLGEVNARMTFGLLARALAERLAAADLCASALTLRVGRRDRDAEGSSADGPPPIRLQLLNSHAADELAVWIELAAAARR